METNSESPPLFGHAMLSVLENRPGRCARNVRNLKWQDRVAEKFLSIARAKCLREIPSVFIRLRQRIRKYLYTGFSTCARSFRAPDRGHGVIRLQCAIADQWVDGNLPPPSPIPVSESFLTILTFSL